MADNSQEVQYQILQEAHETASQLSDAQQTVTVIEVPRTPKSESSPVVVTSSDGVDRLEPITVISGPGVSTNKMMSSGGHVVMVRSPEMVIASQESSSADMETFTMQQIEVDAVPEGMLCLVCADRGTGYHYSVFSCEGCKGFFKRSVQKNLQYTCKDGGNCLLNKFTRNSCQFCRFRKCLEVGMKREAVREDRTPGGKHRHKRQRTTGDGSGGEEGPLMLPTETCDEALLAKLVNSRPDLIPTSEEERSVDDLDLNTLMQYGYMELRLIIEWARKVPGFSELLIEDQMALLKSSFMELNVLRLAFRSLTFEGRVKFAQGIILNPEQVTALGWGKDLVSCTLEFVTRLKDVHIDGTEFCILNAIVLTYPDAPGVQDKTAVLNLQSSILDTLRKYSINRYPNEPRRYGKMLLRLPALRSVSAVAAERFLSMSLDGSIKMNALVLEMMS